jgi:hypothetical protein
MRLRIVRPLPVTLEDFDLTHLKFGACHEIQPPLSDLLLLNGYGVPEDLNETASAHSAPRVAGPKRK